MKYDVKFSCGHTDTIELFGKGLDRERKIKYLEEYGLCKACYRQQQEEKKAAGCDVVEMSYREYKQNHSECATVSGSYNKERKTIKVYIPKKGQEE